MVSVISVASVGKWSARFFHSEVDALYKTSIKVFWMYSALPDVNASLVNCFAYIAALEKFSELLKNSALPAVLASFSTIGKNASFTWFT